MVSSVRQGDSTHLRAVSADSKLPEGARPVEVPTLEEAYLAFMASLGRAEAAIVEVAEEEGQ